MSAWHSQGQQDVKHACPVTQREEEEEHSDLDVTLDIITAQLTFIIKHCPPYANIPKMATNLHLQESWYAASAKRTSQQLHALQRAA